MTGKLLPCPFCGVELYACAYDGGKTRHAHEANGCVLDRRFVQGETQEAAWNRRAPAPQTNLPVVLEAIEAVWKYSLVIESSVRRGDGPEQYAGVTEALRRIKEARAALATPAPQTREDTQ